MASGMQYTPLHYAFGYDGVDDESDIGSDYEDLMASPPSSPTRIKELDEEGDSFLEKMYETHGVPTHNVQTSPNEPTDPEPRPEPIHEPKPAEQVTPRLGAPSEYISKLVPIASDLSSTDKCDEVIRLATSLIASTRAVNKKLVSAIKKSAPRAPVDGSRQRAPKGSRPPTAAGLYNSAMRSKANELYADGKRMDVKKDVKADHIQKILAEMWKNESPEVRQQYIANAKEATASVSQ